MSALSIKIKDRSSESKCGHGLISENTLYWMAVQKGVARILFTTLTFPELYRDINTPRVFIVVRKVNIVGK